MNLRNIEETGPGGGSRVRGFCRCPVCGYERPHPEDMKCIVLVCPECGAKLERDLAI
ncbi:MAG: hypothetical protein JW825_06925 [Candidatus Methanofastidiosa archaeon]|nr:hypothetical protein [Candidatus Methanofastidiosa archaeon]